MIVPQNKTKVMSIRIEDSQYNELREFAEQKGYPKNKFSEYLRSLIISELKAARKGKRLMQVKIKPEHYESIEEKASSMNIKPEKYLGKLVKSRASASGSGIASSDNVVSKDEFNKLKKQYMIL